MVGEPNMQLTHVSQYNQLTGKIIAYFTFGLSTNNPVQIAVEQHKNQCCIGIHSHQGDVFEPGINYLKNILSIYERSNTLGYHFIIPDKKPEELPEFFIRLHELQMFA